MQLESGRKQKHGQVLTFEPRPDLPLTCERCGGRGKVPIPIALESLTPKEVVERTGLTPPEVSRIFSERVDAKRPPWGRKVLRKFVLIAASLNVSLDELAAFLLNEN